MLWGLTPALDLIHEYKNEFSTTGPEEINVLIIGGSDCRHVLKTIARKYRHSSTSHPVKLSFYLVESCVENVARQLLLLYVALQPPEAMGLVQKTKIFMELYGNSLVRPTVAKYLTTAAIELVKMITDFDYLHQIMPLVSLDIRYKERDYLENLLKFWCSTDVFDICDYWDRRLRKTLGLRYDSKLGAFDWDLHMRFHSIGGRQVCNQEYRNFRLSGVAFSWLESEVSKPNRSMVCAVASNGERFLHYGYLGDMVTGPFVGYGLECEDEKLLKSTNGQNSYRATDVTERNLLQIFHEIHTGEEYVHTPTSDMQLGPVVMQVAERVVDVGSSSVTRGKTYKCIHPEGIQIKFLSALALNTMSHKSEYKSLFDIIYVNSNHLKFLTKELIHNVASNQALIIVENQKFVLSHRDKQLKEFEDQINEAMIGVEVTAKRFDALKDNFAKFVRSGS